MANHAVIRTDLMTGTTVGADLVSFIYMDAEGNPAAIENGNVVKLEGLADTNNRELWKAVDPAADTAMRDVVVVAGVELLYDERKKNLTDYINVAGKPVRGYIPHSRDIFSVTVEALDVAEGAEPAVGNIVELMAGTKLHVAAAATEGSTQFGQIIAVEQAGRYTYYVIQVA